ncbi:hypothetical protein BDR04DRAFT_1116461 [Suillus decipiens]|nr:hypothetical protein BDR04DRAFT_1116461 [Suillus decipiens]
MHERSPKRHIPYPLRPSLLKLRLAKRMTRCSYIVYIQKHEDAISSGLSWMSFDTLYKVFKALLAGQEAVHHEVETLLWQVKYSEHVAAFNKVLHQENKDQLKMKDKQLKKIRSLFSGRTTQKLMITLITFRPSIMMNVRYFMPSLPKWR